MKHLLSSLIDHKHFKLLFLLQVLSFSFNVAHVTEGNQLYFMCMFVEWVKCSPLVFTTSGSPLKETYFSMNPKLIHCPDILDRLNVFWYINFISKCTFWGDQRNVFQCIYTCLCLNVLLTQLYSRGNLSSLALLSKLRDM